MKFFSVRSMMLSTGILLIFIYFFLGNFSHDFVWLSPIHFDHLYGSRENRSNKSCMIILRERSGRLGNRLFMFSTAIGLTLTHSCYLKISRDIIDELQQTFDLNLSSITFNPSNISLTTAIHPIYNHCTYFSDLFSSNTSQQIELTGYWQVHKYFVDYSHFIRQQLRFKQSILHRVRTFFMTLPKKAKRIGIHIRRGDFLHARTVSSDHFILNATNYFTKKYRSVVFIIVSDDRPYCKKTFGQRPNVIFTPSSFDASTDLATLTQCDHLIITVGTFGWWGAFLLQNRFGEVITDAKDDLSPIDVQCTRDVYFPSSFSFLNRNPSQINRTYLT